MSFRTDSSSPELSVCSSSRKRCTGAYNSFNITLSGSYNVTVKAQSAVWEATSDPFEFKALHISKCHKVILVDFSQRCPFGFNFACVCILTCCRVHIPPVKIPQPELSNVTLSSDRLLVMWKIWPYDSSNKYHCQVNYSKVRPSWIFLNLISSWSIYWRQPGDSVESQATISMTGVTDRQMSNRPGHH